MTVGDRAGLRQAVADPALAAACHQAAHAVVGILLGIPFSCAEIGPGGAAGTDRLVVEGKPEPATEDGVACALAGAAFDSLLRPRGSLASVLARSFQCGSCKTAWQVRSVLLAPPGSRREGRKNAMGIYLRSKGLVRENWGTIVTVGRLLAVLRHMTYSEVLDAATDPADIREKVEEYLARRHWDLCIHESAHAVMGARDGLCVSMVTVVTQPGDPCCGKAVYGGGEPPMSGSVAGDLAERLWGLSGYYPLGHMLNGASGDFASVALLESRKRGSKAISQEDRRAAMQVWQEEDRKLESRIMRDPTFELQVRVVAKALSLRGTLDGGEVRRIMEEALEACGSPDVPAAAPASGHGG
jgi:hypothetical protein